MALSDDFLNHLLKNLAAARVNSGLGVVISPTFNYRHTAAITAGESKH